MTKVIKLKFWDVEEILLPRPSCRLLQIDLSNLARNQVALEALNL